MPHLCDTVRAAAGDSRAWSVAEVVGQVKRSDLEEAVKSACGEGEAVLEKIELRHLQAVSERKAQERAKERREVLADNGMYILASLSLKVKV